MQVLSFTSHVCYGHVGGQASVLPLQRLGHEVWHVPTVLFSNHPGHNGYGGGPVKLIRVDDLTDGLITRGFVDACDALHTGYLGQGGVEAAVLRALARMRRRDGTLYLCDPVLGDHGRLYVGDAVVQAVRDALLPAADIITPNRFELEVLSGQSLDDAAAVLAACRLLQARGPARVVCTTAAQADGELTLLGLDGADAFAVRAPYIDGAPYGTGDAFAGIVLGRLLNGDGFAAAVANAAAAVCGMIRASKAAGLDELAVVAAQDEVTAPTVTLVAEAIAG